MMFTGTHIERMKRFEKYSEAMTNYLNEYSEQIPEVVLTRLNKFFEVMIGGYAELIEENENQEKAFKGMFKSLKDELTKLQGARK